MKRVDMNKEKDFSLSFIRFIAMIMIFSCHVSQQFGRWSAQFLNVGVQIFLFLSGYLHAYRQNDSLDFLKYRLKRLLVEYYVFLVPVIVFMIIWNRINFNVNDAIKLMTLSGWIHELGHLWFVPTILVCFLFTPLFWDIFDSFSSYILIKRNYVFAIINFLIFILFQMIFGATIKAAWISCYLMGIFVKRINNKIERKWWLLCNSLFSIVYMGIRFGWGIGWIDISDKFEKFVYILFNYGHVSLGIMLFFILKNIFLMLPIKVTNIIQPILLLSDKYSYDIYLVHHFLVLGAYSLFIKFENFLVALTIILIGTCVWGAPFIIFQNCLGKIQIRNRKIVCI